MGQAARKMDTENETRGHQAPRPVRAAEAAPAPTLQGALVMTDFVREAIKEKATRELGALEQRAEAFGGVERARDALHTVSSDLTQAVGSVGAVSADPTVSARMKKLRKLVEDSLSLATELSDTLGAGKHRAELETQRKAILEALAMAGVEAPTLAKA